MSSIVIPARLSACRDACTGPRPMISGDSAESPVETILARGVMPRSAALRSLMTTSAAAPSLSGQQLPAAHRLLGEVPRQNPDLLLGATADAAQLRDVLRGLAHRDVDIRDGVVL